MNTVAKRAAKTHAILRALKSDNEPLVRPETYDSDLTKALVWYNNHEEDKAKRNWVNVYLTKTDRKHLVTHFNDIQDWDIRQLGVICRLKLREQFLSQKEETWIEDRITAITNMQRKPKRVAATNTAPVVSIQDRMEERARTLASEIDGAIDDFTINKKTEFSVKAYLSSNQVPAPIAKRIGDFYTNLSSELREAIVGKDPQLVEGYSHFTKRELKKFADFVDTVIGDCQQQMQTAKANRAPRARKAVLPTKLVSRMKFLKEFAEFKLKSPQMTSIIGSSEVWFYNTKYRRVGVYKGENGGALSVRGTSIIGIDIKESKVWTLRKPADFFKGLSMGKRALNNAVKVLTTKPVTPNGRFNEDTILLGAF